MGGVLLFGRMVECHCSHGLVREDTIERIDAPATGGGRRADATATRRHGARALVLTLLLALSLLAIPAPTVRAATRTVTNTNDSGPGSLRQEISDAAPGDTITFALPAGPQSIALSSAPLSLFKQVTIQGPGSGALTVTASISGMTISNTRHIFRERV